MSRVKTLQDIETESEQITMKKSLLDRKMKAMNEELLKMNSEVLKKGVDARTKNEKLQICLENYNKMKAERDTAKQQIKELREMVEKMKNSHKPVEKLKGFEFVATNDDIEKGIDKLYNEHGKKEVDEFRKMFEE